LANYIEDSLTTTYANDNILTRQTLLRFAFTWRLVTREQAQGFLDVVAWFYRSAVGRSGPVKIFDLVECEVQPYVVALRHRPTPPEPHFRRASDARRDEEASSLKILDELDRLGVRWTAPRDHPNCRSEHRLAASAGQPQRRYHAAAVSARGGVESPVGRKKGRYSTLAL
jgi:hypothetical protein